MFIELFQKLGLSKNEAEIYEVLLEIGEASVTRIATKTNINRRNVYDVLNRMMSKGLVFPVIDQKENIFKPSAPSKLMEILKEKEQMFDDARDDLDNLYRSIPKENEVFIYKGPEGWKNYMRDMIRIGEPAYFIGAKGAWLDERVKNFFPQFFKETKKKNIKFYHLFDHKVKKECPEILKFVKNNYKFLPKEYSTPGAIDIFGDHVNILSNIHPGGFDEDFSFSVIVNKQIADSFRTWFQFMYDFCPKEK
jgi:predicted transcriptional regulator